MDVRTVCYAISAVSAGYIVLSLVRPVVIGGRLRLTIPWCAPHIGDLILPDGTICRLPPEGNPAADAMYELLSHHPDVEEVPVGCVYIQRRGITAIVPLRSRVGAILI